MTLLWVAIQCCTILLKYCLLGESSDAAAHSDATTIDGRVCDYVIFDLDYPQLEQPFRISWHKGNTSSQCWTHGNTGHGQCIFVFPNGTLGFHVVRKEDAGLCAAMVCNSPQHCLYQRKFQVHVHGVEAFKEIMELIGGSIFLNLRQSQNTSSSFRLDRIQECDHGRYSVEVNDRDGRTVYECIANVKVGQKETFGRSACHVLFYILIVSLGLVTITVVVALLWHFQKRKDRADGDRPKLPGCKSVKVVKPPASIGEMCISLNVENTTHPESEHCRLPGQLYITLCNSDSVLSGSIEFWKYHEGDMSSLCALIKSKRALPEDQYGDSACSSSH